MLLSQLLASRAQVLRQPEETSAIRLVDESVQVHVVLHLLHPALGLQESLTDAQAHTFLAQQPPDVRNRCFMEVHIAEAARQPRCTRALPLSLPLPQAQQPVPPRQHLILGLALHPP